MLLLASRRSVRDELHCIPNHGTAIHKRNETGVDVRESRRPDGIILKLLTFSRVIDLYYERKRGKKRGGCGITNEETILMEELDNLVLFISRFRRQLASSKRAYAICARMTARAKRPAD